MKKICRMLLLILMAVSILSGCVMRTVDELYCLPKRSRSDNDMQAVIDQAMAGLCYCAPVYGTNRQMVQPADLDGDGVNEYVVLAKGGAQRQLKILIFGEFALGYALMDTIEGYGSAFDFIEFANVDDRPGVEIVVGRQVGDGPIRSAAVYRLDDGRAQQILEASYAQFLTYDMDGDGRSELITIHPGETGDVVCNTVLYRYADGQLSRGTQLAISASASNIKSLDPVVLQDGKLAVMVVSEEGDSQLMEIISYRGGALQHVYGPVVVSKLHDHFVYPSDVDRDGDTEMPELLPMYGNETSDTDEYWIVWFGVNSEGKRSDGMYTYYSYADKWYIHIDRNWINKMTVTRSEGICTFMNRDNEVVMTIYALTGVNRKEQAQQLGGVVLGSSETITFAVTLGPGASALGITEQRVKQMFYGLNLALYTEEE